MEKQPSKAVQDFKLPLQVLVEAKNNKVITYFRHEAKPKETTWFSFGQPKPTGWVQTGRRLGSGTYGEVYCQRLIVDGKEYESKRAVKTLFQKDFKELEALAAIFSVSNNIIAN